MDIYRQLPHFKDQFSLKFLLRNSILNNLKSSFRCASIATTFDWRFLYSLNTNICRFCVSFKLFFFYWQKLTQCLDDFNAYIQSFILNLQWGCCICISYISLEILHMSCHSKKKGKQITIIKERKGGDRFIPNSGTELYLCNNN